MAVTSRFVGWEGGQDGASVALARVARNPFYVLELALTAGLVDVEQACARLIAAFGHADSTPSFYATPLGPQPRDRALIERACAELLDPDQRVKHEAWHAGDPMHTRQACSGGWSDALVAFGWRRR